jgi:membrane protein YqaA with SNARE-associated domain
MTVLHELDTKVEQVLSTQSVGRAQRILQSRAGWWIVGVISFLESALPLPIITDPFLVASVLLNRQKALWLWMLTTATSVLGGFFAYLTAYLFIDRILSWLSPGLVTEFQSLAVGSGSSIFMLTLIGALTPVPYTVVAWAVGALEGSVLMFAIASVFGRGFRYAVVTWLTYRFGPMATRYARKYLGLTSILVVIAAAIVFWLKM